MPDLLFKGSTLRFLLHLEAVQGSSSFCDLLVSLARGRNLD